MNKQRNIPYLKKERGSYSVEGAFIFPWIFFLVFALLRLTFTLHDAALDEACTILTGLRLEQAQNYAYDNTGGTLKISWLINRPLTGSETGDEAYEETVRARADSYFEAHKFLKNSKWDGENADTVIHAGKNAEILRAGNRVIQILEENE